MPSLPSPPAGSFLVLLLALTALAGCRGDPTLPAEFTRANLRLQSGDAEGAGRSYQQLIERHGPRRGLLVNLAEAQLRQGQPGPAILALERACLLAPAGSDPWQRRQHALDDAHLAPVDPAGPWQQLCQVLPRRHWSWLAAAAAAALLLLWLAAALRPARRPPWASSIPLALLLAFTLVILHQRRGERELAIVLSAGDARLSPRADAPPSLPLLAGQRVRAERTEGDWLWLIEPAGNALGWAPRAQVEWIEPGPRPE